MKVAQVKKKVKGAARKGHMKVARGAARTICIQITVTEDEHTTLVSAAEADGRSLRQFVKWNALKAANKAA